VEGLEIHGAAMATPTLPNALDAPDVLGGNDALRKEREPRWCPQSREYGLCLMLPGGTRGDQATEENRLLQLELAP